MDIWGYDQETGSFKKYDADDWKNEITHEGASRYLIEQLKQSLINDFETAYNAYIENNTGYFGSIRLIFPVITFLGTILKGRDGSPNSVAFIQTYMGQVNENYRNFGDVLYAIYRHGLAHTNMPKIIKVNNRDVGWVITLGNEPHLTLSNQGLKEYNIWINPMQLYADLCKAIDRYQRDLISVSNPDLLDAFKAGYIEMAKYHHRRDIRMNTRRGFTYLEQRINNF